MTNDLVVYKKGLDLSKHVSPLMTSLRSLGPETRVVSEDQMYIGCFSDIGFDKHGVNAIAALRFLKSRENSKNEGLVGTFTKKLFGDKKPDDVFHIEHEGTHYHQVWSVCTGGSVSRALRQVQVLSRDYHYTLLSLCSPWWYSAGMNQRR